MRALERLRDDFTVLRQMLRGMPSGEAHAERLQAFYAPQAAHYDDFRDRLLPGRAALIDKLPLPDGARVVELGTGRNVEFFGARIARIASFEVVDLCPALLNVARERTRSRHQIRAIKADATTYQPQQPVDCVYFSYALTMIPNWRAALDNAYAMLKPGGIVGAVDFHLPMAQRKFSLRSFERTFWSRWFGHDGVRLDSAHLAELKRIFHSEDVVEARARVPYLPGLKVPYYVFVGRKAPVD